MYREQGSQSALSGVPSGPYSGGAKRIDPARLASGTLAKLARSLNGVGEPQAVAFDGRRELLSMRPRAWWGLLLPVVITTLTFMTGLRGGDGRALDAWIRQPSWAFVLYALAGMLFVIWIFAIVRRRSDLDVLHPGTYLFPLDLVVVGARDVAGRQLVTVWPLGGARDARALRTNHPRRSDLRIRFQDSTEIALGWPGDPDSALRHLALTQRLLDELTFSGTIDAAFKNDLFFDLRADDSWASVAPNEAGATARARSRLGSLVVSRLAPLYVVVLGALLGAVPFAARHRLGERIIFQDAVERGTPEALEAYVANGGPWVSEAMTAKRAILERRRIEELERQADEAREKAAAKFGEPPPPRATREECSKALAATQAEKHPEVFAMMQRLLDNASDAGTTSIPITFRRKTGIPPIAEPTGDDLDRRLYVVERTFVKSFTRVFSETCPTNILAFSQASATSAAKIDASTGLDIAYDLEWTAKTYPASAAGEREVHAINVVFDVTFHVPGESLDARPKTTFRLTMPPPNERLTKARAMSIFTVAEQDPVFDAMVARAFDRLYDEVYGLFFRGAPKVPVMAAASSGH